MNRFKTTRSINEPIFQKPILGCIVSQAKCDSHRLIFYLIYLKSISLSLSRNKRGGYRLSVK